MQRPGKWTATDCRHHPLQLVPNWEFCQSLPRFSLIVPLAGFWRDISYCRWVKIACELELILWHLLSCLWWSTCEHRWSSAMCNKDFCSSHRGSGFVWPLRQWSCVQLDQTTRVYFHKVKLVQGLKIARTEQPCKDRGVSLFLLPLSVPEAMSFWGLMSYNPTYSLSSCICHCDLQW